MKIYYMPQGSPDWHAIRKGKLTASHAQAIAANGKGLQTYVREIVTAMINEPEHYTNKDMERGNELEPIARIAYEFENDVTVQQVGFIEYNEFAGCSPDGLVESDGGIEIKARNDKIHFGLLLGDNISSGTIWQIQMNLLITGRKWWDFRSYNPNFRQSSFTKRIYPDEAKFEKLRKGLVAGEQMLKDLLKNENIQRELLIKKI